MWEECVLYKSDKRNQTKSEQQVAIDGQEVKRGGILDIFSGGEVQPGPSNPDPV